MSQLSLFKGKRQRGVKPPSPKEFTLHVMVADVLRRWAMPGWLWTHFPAGEWRHPATAMRLKRMGVQAGWPDFILLAPNRQAESPFDGAHFLELKRKGGTLSDAQLVFEQHCSFNGYPYVCTSDFKEAVDVLKLWGAVRASVSA